MKTRSQKRNSSPEASSSFPAQPTRTKRSRPSETPYRLSRPLSPPQTRSHPNPGTLIRSSKCPRKWGDSELESLRIIRTRVNDAATFFGASPRAPSFAWSEYRQLLTARNIGEIKGTDPGSRLMRAILHQIHYISEVDQTSITPKRAVEESTSNLLVAHLLSVMGYTEIVDPTSSEDFVLRPVRINKRLTLLMDSDAISAEADVCIMDGKWSSYVHFISEDKVVCIRHTPVQQLVGVCIATFQSNNAVRCYNGIAQLEAMVFPATIWKGNTPTFYLVRISLKLADACASGQTPEYDTYLYEYDPLNREDLTLEEPGPSKPKSGLEDSSLGLLLLKNRYPVFEALENLKDFIPEGYDDTPAAWQRLEWDTSSKQIRGKGKGKASKP